MPPLIIVDGPTGCGKSTVADRIARKLNYACISPEAILERIARSKDHSRHHEIAKILLSGQAVPHDLAMQCVKTELTAKENEYRGMVVEAASHSAIDADLARAVSPRHDSLDHPPILVSLSIGPEDLRTRTRGFMLDPITGTLYDPATVWRSRRALLISASSTTSGDGEHGDDADPNDEDEGGGHDEDEMEGDDDDGGGDMGKREESAGTATATEAPVFTPVFEPSDPPLAKAVLDRLATPPAFVLPNTDVLRPAHPTLAHIPFRLALDATLSPSTLVRLIEQHLKVHIYWSPFPIATALPPQSDADACLTAELPSTLDTRLWSTWGKHCPVSKHRENKLVAGDPSFAVAFERYVYLTSSEESQRALESNPSRYLWRPPTLTAPKIAVITYPGVAAESYRLADQVARFFSVKHVDVLAVLQKMVAQVASDPDAAMDPPIGKMLVKKLTNGKTEPPDMLAEVIKAHALSSSTDGDSHAGWVLSGCPLTRETAVAMAERHLVPDILVVVRPDLSSSKSSGDASNTPSDDVQLAFAIDSADMASKFAEEVSEIVLAFQEASDKLKVVHQVASPEPRTAFARLRREIDPFAPRAEPTKVLADNPEYGSCKDFCPVSLAKKKVLIRGSPDFAVVYQGHVYQCANEPSRAVFLEDPEAFLDVKLPPPRFCFVGPSGAGKSTLAKTFDQLHGLPTIVFNHHLRDLRANDNELGEHPDSDFTSIQGVVLDLLLKPLYENPKYEKSGFILEGFPRNRTEAEALVTRGWVPDAIVLFQATVDTVVGRLVPIVLQDNPHLESIEQEHAENDEDNPIATLKADLAATAERELEELEGINEWLETSTIVRVNVNGNRTTRVVAHQIAEGLAPVLDHRSDIFFSSRPVKESTIASALSLGHRKVSSQFGHRCPVTLQEVGVPTETTLGKYPLAVGDKVYFFTSKHARSRFSVSPSTYLSLPLAGPSTPLRIAVDGDPRAGKSTLAKQLARAIGVPVVDPGVFLEQLLSEPDIAMPARVRMLRDAFRRGCGVSATEVAAVIHAHILTRMPSGCVLDDADSFMSSGSAAAGPVVPDLLFVTCLESTLAQLRTSGAALPFPELVSQAHASGAQRHAARSEDMARRYSTVVNLSPEMSRWRAKAVASQSVVGYVRRRLAVVRAAATGRAAQMVKAGIDTVTVRTGPSEGYCAVCLSKGAFTECGSDWADAAIYKETAFHLCSPAHLAQFLANPQTYAPIPVPDHIPSKEPADADKKKQEPEIPLALMPPGMYMDKAVQAELAPALKDLGKLRPKLPFLSPKASAVIILALILKSRNKRLLEHVRRAWQERLESATQRAKLSKTLSGRMVVGTLPAVDVSTDVARFFETGPTNSGGGSSGEGRRIGREAASVPI
ncbi:hypothetical protein BC828DRAFT_389309 [Blastocladiella britannica]|nr:hypothetical protein BC828DRAFT_389309 [Blastocladiella britannica]